MHDYKIIERGCPLKKASKALLLLHGRGATAFDILNLAPQFCDENFYVAAPQATHNSWYPYSFMSEEKENQPWLSSAIEIVKKLIDETALHIPKSQIYLMGFSQGACLALEVSSRYATKYGGIAAFSGGLIGRILNEKNYKGEFEGTKIFIGNSDKDPHIPLSRCEESKIILKNLGANITLKVYKDRGHTINEDEINWVKKNIIVH